MTGKRIMTSAGTENIVGIDTSTEPGLPEPLDLGRRIPLARLRAVGDEHDDARPVDVAQIAGDRGNAGVGSGRHGAIVACRAGRSHRG